MAFMYPSTKQAKVKLPLFTCWWRSSAFIVRVLLILSFFTDFKHRYEFKLCMQELVRPAGFIPSISYINFTLTSWHTQAPPWKKLLTATAMYRNDDNEKKQQLWKNTSLENAWQVNLPQSKCKQTRNMRKHLISFQRAIFWSYWQ